MKKAGLMIGIVLWMAAGSAWAKGEEDDWRWAERQGDVKAYDQYLLQNPTGAHTDQARKTAGRKSAEQLRQASENCSPQFPLMLYYTVTAEDDPLLPLSKIAEALNAAVECKFAPGLSPEERMRGMDILFQIRDRLLPQLEIELPLPALFNLDFILLELEEAVVEDTYKKIVKCSDQSAWVDTSPQKAYECSKPYIKIQENCANQMSTQAKFGFARVAQVKDREYRAKFWDRYRKMAKREIWVELAKIFSLIKDLEEAKKAETDLEIIRKIEDVQLRMAAGGKPIGGGWAQ